MPAARHPHFPHFLLLGAGKKERKSEAPGGQSEVDSAVLFILLLFLFLLFFWVDRNSTLKCVILRCACNNTPFSYFFPSVFLSLFGPAKCKIFIVRVFLLLPAGGGGASSAVDLPHPLAHFTPPFLSIFWYPLHFDLKGILMDIRYHIYHIIISYYILYF